MNQQQRKELRAIVNQIAAESDSISEAIQKIEEGRNPQAIYTSDIIPVIAALRDCYDTLEEQQETEQEKFDNLSGLQQTDSGTAIEAAVEALSDARSYLDSALQTLADPGDLAVLADTLHDMLDNDMEDVVGSIEAAIEN